MLRLPPFDLRSPRSLEDASAILAGELSEDGGGVRVVAGGTDLWPNMKRRHQSAKTVVSLMRVADLEGIANGGGDLRIGATSLLEDIARNERVRCSYPALASAVASISSPLLRNMGTLGGNLCLDTRCTYYNQSEEWRRSIDYCMKEAGSVCWVAPSSAKCLAVSSGDTAPILCALGARARLASAAGERTVAVSDLFRDDGIDYLRKRPDEILVEVLLPARSDAEHCISSFRKLRRRGSIDFAVLTVATALWVDSGGVVTEAAIRLGAVASLPRAVPEAESALVGRPLGEESIREAAALCRRAATPLDNTDFTAQWRGRMVEVYAAGALRDCAESIRAE